MTRYDDFYGQGEALFGKMPEPILENYLSLLHAGQVVLDVGAGQGRNALFAAAGGLKVHALEPSRVAGAALETAARERKLDIDIFPTTFTEFAPPLSHYAGIMVFGLIPDLDQFGIADLQRHIAAWSRKGSLLWITGFTTDDPSYVQRKADWRETGANVFTGPEGQVRTYLEPGQICELFAEWEVLHHWEGLGPEHRHGDGPRERHGKFEAVLRR